MSESSVKPPKPPRTLTREEFALVENWVQLADSLGLPKSLAQIYGFVFASRKPVTAQDCVDALKISRSSAGQGLKTLKELGAVKPAFELGARRDSFSIEPDLGVLIQSVFKSRISPAFELFFANLGPIQGRLDPTQDKFLHGRLQKLERWKGKLGRVGRWVAR